MTHPFAPRRRPARPSHFGTALGALAFGLVGAAASGPAFAQAAPDGSQVFTSAGCSGCHGQDGNGGIGPKLAGDHKLSNDQAVIHQILNGGGSMPAFKDQLSNAEIAAVASYIRTNFGNSFGKITEQQVAQAKGGASAGGNADAGGGNANGGGGNGNAGASAPSTTPSNGGSANAPGASESENPASGEPQGHTTQSESAGNGGENDEGNQPQMAVGAPSQTVNQPSTDGPDQQALDGAADATDSWLMYNKGYNGQRYSSLDQITAANAKDLRPVCIAQLGDQTPFEASPVVYDGLLYITTAYATVAMDATTCTQKWTYTYSPTGAEPFNTNRGVAIAGGRVFRGTSDGHMIALDAKTGKLLWNIRPVDSAEGYFLSAAPIVWHDMLFMGTAGADWGAPAHMYAFDVKDGTMLWDFDEIVDKTFGGADPAATGGGSNWTSFTLDADTGKLYVPVGNPAPDFAAQYRPGDNLYTNSILVLDAKTGKLDHYYQQIANDNLDRDTAAAPVLYTLKDDNGNKTLYTAAANKAGHMFGYNEATQKQVFKVETTTIKNEGAPPTKQGTHVCPGIDGGVEWNGPAFDPNTAALYVPSVDWCTTFTLGEVRYTPGQLFFGGSYSNDKIDTAKGWIRAFDARTGETKWQYQSKLPVVAAVTPTKGGVIFSGELTNDFIVLDEKTGKKLYHFNTGGPVAAGVITYEIGSTQYVAVASGNVSRTWSPNATPSATMVIFALPDAETGGTANMAAAGSSDNG